jgi:hypothetical protein
MTTDFEVERVYIVEYEILEQEEIVDSVNVVLSV